MEGQTFRKAPTKKRKSFSNEENFLSRGGADVCQPESATFNPITDLLEHFYPIQSSMKFVPVAWMHAEKFLKTEKIQRSSSVSYIYSIYIFIDGYQLFFQ